MSDRLQTLTLASIADVKGGLVSQMFARALHRMVVDIEGAPDISDWRELTLKVRAKPIAEVQGGMVQLQDVAVEFVVPGVKLPARVTSVVTTVRRDSHGAHQLMFAMDAPDNPDQHTLFEEENADA